MAASASGSPVREILEEPFLHLLRELEQVFDAQLSLQVAAQVEGQLAQRTAEAGARARQVLADQLNQTMRRICQASDRSAWSASVADAAASFAASAALFEVTGSMARGAAIRGVSPELAAEFLKAEISLASAAALAEAVGSRDPVTALPEEAQVSPLLRRITGVTSEQRVYLYPIVAGDQVPACLYAWGAVQGSALEVLTQLAGAAWANLPSLAEAGKRGKDRTAGRAAWDSLSAEEQRLHLRAQRFARVQVANIRLYEAGAVQSGRAGRDLYTALGARLDAARESFRRGFFDICPSMVDYLHIELLHTLANDDPEVLGKDYPGAVL